MSSSLNITSIKTTSNGVWQGDNPLHFAFPLLILQSTLILLLSRCLSFLLKPLRQPNVIAEILGGILLGPSLLGRNQAYLHLVFPSWSTPILESLASIGLLFFLFLVGLELDLSSVRRSGSRAATIAAVGISVPFLFSIGVSSVFRRVVGGTEQVGFSHFFVFMGVALSITAFPVLARILAELKLLTTDVGETTMAAAALNDVAAWILLALALALAGNGQDGVHKSPLISIWVLLSGVGFVVFMFVVIRPAMRWVARRASRVHDTVDEACICLTLAGVLVFGFVTDLMGLHSIFGAFIFGLSIPKGGQLAERLTVRIEDFVSGLLLPLYFASNGLKTDVTKMRGGVAWALLALVTGTACVGKIVGTFAVAMAWKIPARESLTLGVLMNTKGLVELIVLNIGKEKKVLNEETFTILVLMAIITTFITTPIVMAIYKPARGGATRTRRKLEQDLSGSETSSTDNLRILSCVHGPGNVPSLINLVESTRSTNKNSFLRLYIVRLVELTERSSSIMMVQRVRRNGLPFVNRFRRDELHDRVAIAFQAYGQLGRVSVRATTAISALPTMHEDICHVAEEKRAAMIVLPFHKQYWRGGSGDESLSENMGNGWREVNRRVLENAPCTVAILVDRGLGSGVEQQRVCIVFLGGPDDREALELGGRMAQHPAVRVSVVRFVEEDGLVGKGALLLPSPEEKAVGEFKRRCGDGLAQYTEKAASNVVEDVVAMGRSGDYDLVVVGKGRFPSTVAAALANRQAEHSELGSIGDVLASSGHGVVCSVLVIQQHDLGHAPGYEGNGRVKVNGSQNGREIPRDLV
ncbi:cation/H(+) antiporter 20 [Malania oleifera]|uniref:cation/H(+) antiporter 20 n=1 Tax=Malania oleifera TaxID=397392 RepID=UPI0025AE7758|nr:cation/H(+) antiporter 20 [Malania oleifera]